MKVLPPATGALTRREQVACIEQLRRVQERPRRAEAVGSVVRWRPHESLARTVIGVLTLVARWPATPYASMNVPPRSCPTRP